MALKQDCLAPVETMTWLGLYSMWLSAENFSATAWRSSGRPELGVYLVNPLVKASMAAALMWSGVSKSGSPAAKPQTLIPSAFMALALESMERVREGVRLFAREEMDMALAFKNWF